ncbi:MAG TPA: tetratricopeptide repeat protein, partial [Longimicrobiales bacterium]
LYEIRLEKNAPDASSDASVAPPGKVEQAASPRRYQVDAPLTPLVGRESDLSTALQLLADPTCHVLTLTGPGGIGKTRLAQEIAHRVSGEHAQGACFVALSGVETASMLPGVIADALELPLTASESPIKQLAAFLQEKQLILVLDNFEQLVDGAQLLVDSIARAPNVKAIVTSRRRLRIGGEHVLAIEALSVPATQDEIESSGSGALFLQIAKRNDSRFVLDPEAAQAIARICHVTAGVPLAIELAAAAVGLLSATEIAQTLEENHDWIIGARRDLEPRHQSLHAAFESSWRLLDSEERRAFRRLSVFRSGFDSEAAATVAGAALELLARLVEASLVRRPRAGEFELLEVLRQFAEDKLVANQSEVVDVRRRHSQYFIERLAAIAALPEGSARNAELEKLNDRFADVRAAWLHATSQSAHEDLRRGTDGFFSLLQSRGRSDEGAELFANAAAAMRPIIALKRSDAAQATATLARLLPRQASFTTDLGKISEAQELAAEGLALLRDEGDEEEIAFAVFKHCNIARASGDFNSPVFQEALDRYRALNNLPGVARALNALAAAHQARGHYAEAKALYQESIQLFRRIGLGGEAWAPLNNLSGAYQAAGDSATARKFLEDELQHARRRHQPRALSFLLTNLAHVCQSAGDLSAAQAYLAEAIQLSREMGYRTRMAYGLNTLATIQLARGEVASAGAAYREALEVAVQAQEEPLIAAVL